jgi:hypothetical protein
MHKILVPVGTPFSDTFSFGAQLLAQIIAGLRAETAAVTLKTDSCSATTLTATPS